MQRALALGALLVATALPAPAQVGNEVTVRDGRFEPQELRVSVGATVTWNVLHAGHTITADDGRFDFPADRLTRQGDRFEWTFTEDETVGYYCKVHRASMFGVIVVGAGSPPRPPSTDPPEVRRVPSLEHPTITAAISDAPPDTIVEVEPGFYRQALTIGVPGLVLRGVGENPDEVLLEGMAEHGMGITIAAPDVTIENLTVRRHTFAGIYVLTGDRFRIERVSLIDNTRFGVRAQGVSGGVIRDTVVRGSRQAGFSVEDCDPCDLLVDGSTAEGNLVGLAATNAAGVVVRDSTFRRNGGGIVLRSLPDRGGMPQRGAHVYGNLIEDNTVWGGRPATTEPFEISSGVGVWIAGGWLDVVAGNTIRGHLYNVAVTGLTGPSIGDRVVGNVVSDAREDDLAWDGLGAGVCFSGNRAPDGSAPSSVPPQAEALYPCDLPATAGVPYPVVGARILAHALLG